MEISKDLFLNIRDFLVESLGENPDQDELINDLIDTMDKETGYEIS